MALVRADELFPEPQLFAEFDASGLDARKQSGPFSIRTPSCELGLDNAAEPGRRLDEMNIQREILRLRSLEEPVADGESRNASAEHDHPPGIRGQLQLPVIFARTRSESIPMKAGCVPTVGAR